jgi:flavin reductase (DIM6/NTAB) family NADH-FMN oxidoreductase RutF
VEPETETPIQEPANPQAIDNVYELLDPPVWLVTAADGSHRGGLIATFAARASIVDSLPRMVLGVAKHHRTWELIEASNRFALHLLYPDQLDLVSRFGGQSGHHADKFAGLPAQGTPGGCPLIPHALAWLDCRVEQKMETGDRTLYLAAVEAGSANGHTRPLTVRRLFSNAPQSLVQRLGDLYERDSQLDADAIRRWRSDRLSAKAV